MSEFKNLIPSISPQYLRLLKRVFLDNQNNQEELLNELEANISIIQEADDLGLDFSGDDLKKNLAPRYEKDVIAFQACCSLFIDLLKAGWNLEIGIKGFQISKPSYNIREGKESLDEIKSRMRDVQLINRNNQLKEIETQRFIERMQRPKKIGNERKSVLDLIDDGKELSEYFSDIQYLSNDKICSLLEKFIKPEVVVCYPEDPYYQDEEHYCPYTGLKLKDIWRYFRLTWSIEYKSSFGKSFPILIRNAARPNKPIIGIAQLRSTNLGDNARDTMIGWVNEEMITNKIFKKELDINFVVKCLLTSLDDAINGIRYNDIEFLSKNIIKFPDQAAIDSLKKMYDEEKETRKKELENENSKITRPKGGHLDNDWQSESELPLFKKKRAMLLAEYLEVRKLFNQVNLADNPARGYAEITHHSCKNGSKMISRVLKIIRSTAINENIMDVNVCGAITPYNEILGGKLVASLMASQEMRELFRQRYHSKYKSAAIIQSSKAGKPVYHSDANLLCLTTTSLYGVASSQYNRIKYLKKNYPDLAQNVIWQEMIKDGKSMKTKGIGVYHISNQTIKLLSLLTYKKLKRVEVNSKPGEGTSPKLRKITFAVNLLFDFPASSASIEDILSHSVSRKNYICFLVDEPIKILLKKKKNYTGVKLSSASSISNAWIKRWLLNRIKRKETIEKLKKLNSDVIKKSIYLPEVLEFEKNKNQILMFPEK